MFTSTLAVKTAAVAATAALLVADCGTNTSTPATAPSTSSSTATGTSNAVSPSGSPATRSDYNDADVAFLQMMYVHHAQAVDMAQLAPGRSQNQQLLALAANIAKAQAPEMTQMAAMLQSFGKPAPSTDTATMADMPGIMTPDQMNTLKGLSGNDFDRMWLQMMIDHHTGAIAMSNTELASGTNPDAKNLAQRIIANQQPEIDQMRGMLAQI